MLKCLENAFEIKEVAKNTENLNILLLVVCYSTSYWSIFLGADVCRKKIPFLNFMKFCDFLGCSEAVSCGGLGACPQRGPGQRPGVRQP